MSEEPQIPGGPWSFGRIVIAVIVCAAVIAVLYVALTAMGIVIPPVALTIFWICVIAFGAIIAIKFLIRML